VAPAPGLRWQAAVWLDLEHNERKVMGEDHSGSTSGWQTVGWCSARDDARLIARAYMARHDHYARADVVEHGTDNGVVSLITDTYLPAPDAPERPRPSTAPGPRPETPPAALSRGP
jgi:predicted nicotinamide N-methyase